jgi:putative oxidoreductase
MERRRASCIFGKMIRNKYILIAFRLVVGGVFIWAGVSKIIDPLEFAQNIANYRVFPAGISFFVALVLPWIEVICGVFLILGIFRYASALLLSGFLAVFLVLITATIIRGIDIDCGCFGSLSTKVDYKLILEDSILLFFSLNIYFSHKSVRVKSK